MKAVIVIPARMASTRFPGKPLCDLMGKPMIQWVYEAARQCDFAEDILIATPDQEIADAAQGFGAKAVLTRDDHPSGTDRIAEVAEKVVADIYVNVQGDEPLIAKESIEACARPLLNDPSVQMGSLYATCEGDDSENPAVVKVVVDLNGCALYFSRYPIPYGRTRRYDPIKKHIGLYAYKREVLMAFAGWPPSPLEQSESLEQLRFMENGVRIVMSKSEAVVLGVDTPEQAEQVRSLLADR